MLRERHGQLDEISDHTKGFGNLEYAVRCVGLDHTTASSRTFSTDAHAALWATDSWDYLPACKKKNPVSGERTWTGMPRCVCSRCKEFACHVSHDIRHSEKHVQQNGSRVDVLRRTMNLMSTMIR